MRGIWISTDRRSSLLGPPGGPPYADPVTERHRTDAAAEMPAPWKPQTGFHRALEISQRTRDSHVPTSRFLFVLREPRATDGHPPRRCSLDR